MTLLAAGLAALLAGAPERAAAETLLVARHDLARGVVLTADDIDTLVVVAEGVARRAARDADGERAAPGWRTRRVVRGGEPLRAPAVAPPPLVARGATVTLVWEGPTLRLTRQGTALGDARRGDRVAVRVDATRRFTGVVSGAGTVVVR